MPELPEVEIIRQYLDEQLPGRTIACADILLPRQLKYPEPEAFQSLVAGKRMKGMRRRGKYLLLDLHDGSTIVFHLRMTGSLVYDPSGRQRDAYARMVFHLADGGALIFADVRTFGCVYGFAACETIDVPGLQSLGPEPLSDDFTSSYLAAAIKGRRQPVKSFLLDQRRIAGLGNIYADEALFLARIDPRRAAGSLSAQECRCLAESVRKVLRDGIADGGTTFRDYRNGAGESGHHQEHLYVYHREGKPCPICGRPVEKTTVGGRGTHFCAHCQR